MFEVVLSCEDESYVTARPAETSGRASGRFGERLGPCAAVDQAGGDADRAHASSICSPGIGASGGGPGSWPISSRKRRAESGALLERLLLNATWTWPASSASV